MSGWINTSSGRKFYPLDPDPRDIVIEDIAHALAHQCRYGGHSRFYSVAEHSVLLAYVMRQRNLSATHERYALLHDASEAYLSDIPRPLKVLPEFDFYRARELVLQEMIYLKFGLDPDFEPEEVSKTDKAMTGTEKLHVFEAWNPDWKDAAPLPELDGLSVGMSPLDAKSAFLYEYRRLWRR